MEYNALKFIELYESELTYPETKTFTTATFYNIYAELMERILKVDTNKPLYRINKLVTIETVMLLLVTPLAISKMHKNILFREVIESRMFEIARWLFDEKDAILTIHSPYYRPLIDNVEEDVHAVLRAIELMNNTSEKPCMCCYGLDRRRRFAFKTTRNNKVPVEYSGLPIYVRSANYTKYNPIYEPYFKRYCDKCKSEFH